MKLRLPVFASDGVEADFEEVFEHSGGVVEEGYAAIGGVDPSHGDFGDLHVQGARDIEEFGVETESV